MVSLQTQLQVWVCGSGLEAARCQSWLDNQVLLLGPCWVGNDTAPPKSMLRLLWKEREPGSHSRGLENKFNRSILLLPELKSNVGYGFIFGNPSRGVLGALTIRSIFPPTFICNYNSNNKANPLLTKQVTGFCLLFANHQPAHTQQCPASVREPAAGTRCYDNNMRLNHPDRQDTHNCVITCSHLFKGNFISAAESTLENKS